MVKTFYTERDIEDLANQGVKSLVVSDDVVLTDLARDRARRLDIELVPPRDEAKPAPSEPQASIPAAQPPAPAASPAKDADLEGRIFASVKARLGGQVDDALLRTIVQRVINSLRRS
jgi:hypothetical protein